MSDEGSGIHVPVHPLGLFYDVQAGVDDELVHVLGGVREAEARDAISAAFGGAEGDVEERRVAGGEDCEVV